MIRFFQNFRSTQESKECNCKETSSSNTVYVLKSIYRNVQDMVIPRVYAITISNEDKRELFEQYKDILYPEVEDDSTGWERLKRLYNDYRNGYTSEFNIVYTIGWVSLMAGFIYGGAVNNLADRERFIKRHNEMVYEGEYLAKRKLIDMMYVQSFKKGISGGLSFLVFPTTFAAFTILSMTYRNYINPLDFAAASGAALALKKTWLGPKAQFAAAVSGGVYGFLVGGVIWTLFKINNITVPEFRAWYLNSKNRQNTNLGQYSWQRYREYLSKLDDDDERKMALLIFKHDDWKDRYELDKLQDIVAAKKKAKMETKSETKTETKSDTKPEVNVKEPENKK